MVRPSDSPQVKVNLEHSTFFGTPLSLKHLLKRAAAHVPTINEDGRVDQLVLEMMNVENSVGEIADSLLQRFPDRFKTRKSAMTHVGDISSRYSA